MEIRCLNEGCNSSSIEKIDDKYKCNTCGKEYKFVEVSKVHETLINKSTKLLMAIMIISLIVTIILLSNTNSSINKYQNAIQLKNAEKYQEAKIIFSQLGEFIDSKAQIEICDKAISDNTNYAKALDLMKSEKYEEAKVIFEDLGNFKDSNNKLEECNKAIRDKEKYDKAFAFMNEKRYQEAEDLFEELGNYKDSKNKILECNNNIIYKKALDYMNSGNYQFAKDTFNSLGDFKDSRDKIEHFDENIYNEAIEAKKQENLEEAIKKFKYLVFYKDSSDQMRICEEINLIKNAKVGDIVKYGNYEQDANEANGKEPIEWIVLDKKDNKVFLLSKYGLEMKNYHKNNNKAVWNNCLIRNWLNNDFISNAFNNYEILNINDTKVEQHPYRNSKDFNQGIDTIDKIFLLSVKEYYNYFINYNYKEKLQKYASCEPTDFVKGKSDYNKNGPDRNRWRTRTSDGYYQNVTIEKGEELVLFTNWYSESTTNKGLIRPAMWVKLEFNE